MKKKGLIHSPLFLFRTEYDVPPWFNEHIREKNQRDIKKEFYHIGHSKNSKSVLLTHRVNEYTQLKDTYLIAEFNNEDIQDVIQSVKENIYTQVILECSPKTTVDTIKQFINNIPNMCTKNVCIMGVNDLCIDRHNFHTWITKWEFVIKDKTIHTYNVYISLKPMRIYTDMAADIFHAGHVKYLKQCKELFPSVCLIVGVHDNNTIMQYKRQPICDEKDRYTVVKGCRYVDYLVPNAPLKHSEELYTLYNIDMVVHADGIEIEERNMMFKLALDKGIYREVPRTNGISTTDIIRRVVNRYEEFSIDVVET